MQVLYLDHRSSSVQNKLLVNFLSHSSFALYIDIIHWFSTKEFLKTANHETTSQQKKKKMQLEIFHTVFIF